MDEYVDINNKGTKSTPLGVECKTVNITNKNSHTAPLERKYGYDHSYINIRVLRTHA